MLQLSRDCDAPPRPLRYHLHRLDGGFTEEWLAASSGRCTGLAMFGRDPDLGPYRLFPGVRIEPERTALAGIHDLAVTADQVQPHRQRDVAFLYAVVDRIDQHRHLQIEVDLAHSRHRGALGIAPRLAEADVLPKVLRHPPTIVGVRFPDVDEVERDLVPVRAIDFVQAHGPITRRRSGIGAENEADRLTVQRR